MDKALNKYRQLLFISGQFNSVQLSILYGILSTIFAVVWLPAFCFVFFASFIITWFTAQKVIQMRHHIKSEYILILIDKVEDVLSWCLNTWKQILKRLFPKLTERGPQTAKTTPFLLFTHLNNTNPHLESEKIIRCIIDDFILIWYDSLSDNLEFINETKHLLQACNDVLFKRLSKLRLQSCVANILNVSRHHLEMYQSVHRQWQTQPTFRKKHKIVKEEFRKVKTVESMYEKQNLFHPALTNCDTEYSYLSIIANVIMKSLTKSSQYECALARDFLVMTVTCNLLIPIINRFSDPYWIHKAIVDVLSEVLVDDIQVNTEAPHSGVQHCDRKVFTGLCDNEVNPLSCPSISKRETIKNKSDTELHLPGNQPMNIHGICLKTTDIGDTVNIDIQTEANVSITGNEAPSISSSDQGLLNNHKPHWKTTDIGDTVNIDIQVKKPDVENSGNLGVQVIPYQDRTEKFLTITNLVRTSSQLSLNFIDAPIEKDEPELLRSHSAPHLFAQESTSITDHESENAQEFYSMQLLSQYFNVEGCGAKKLNLEKTDSDKSEVKTCTSRNIQSSEKCCSSPDIEDRVPKFFIDGNEADDESGTENRSLNRFKEHNFGLCSNFADSSSLDSDSLISLSPRASSQQLGDELTPQHVFEGEENIAGCSATERSQEICQPKMIFTEVCIQETSRQVISSPHSYYVLYHIQYKAYFLRNNEWILIGSDVRRRFREFLTLQDRLEEMSSLRRSLKDVKKVKKTMMVTIGNPDEKLVEGRRVFLEQYLKDLISKEDINNSMALREFLAYDTDKSIAFVKKANEMPRLDKVFVRTITDVVNKITTVLPSLPDDYHPPPHPIGPKARSMNKIASSVDLNVEGWQDVDAINILLDTSCDPKHCTDSVDNLMEEYLTSMRDFDNNVSSHSSLDSTPDSTADSTADSKRSRSDTCFYDIEDQGLLREINDTDRSMDITSELNDQNIALSAAVLHFGIQLTSDKNIWVNHIKSVKFIKTLIGRALNVWLGEQIEDLTSPERCSYYLHLLRTTIWPEEEETADYVPDDQDRELMKELARKTICDFLPGFLPQLVGPESFEVCLDELFACLQNPKLNKHLILNLLDCILEQVIPEVNTSQFHKDLWNTIHTHPTMGD